MNPNGTTGTDRPSLARIGCLLLGGLTLFLLLSPAILAMAVIALPVVAVVGGGLLIVLLIFFLGLPLAFLGLGALFIMLLLGALFTGTKVVLGSLLKLALFVVAPIVLLVYFLRRVAAA